MVCAEGINHEFGISRYNYILNIKYTSSYCIAPWRRKWQPLQYSCLESPVDRGARWPTVHGVRESDTTEHTHAM